LLNHKVTLVTMTKYADIWAAFERNIREYVPHQVKRIVVVDGDQVKPSYPWRVIQGPPVFSMAGNYNVGWKAAEQDSDILCLNDDITFLGRYPVEALQELAYSDPQIGAVACRVAVGRVGNPLQENPRKDRELTFVKTCGNGATYFKREVINKIGYMDDTFTEPYGAEDADYTWRCNMAGFLVGVSRDVHVKHGFGPEGTHSATSLRTLGTKITAINKLGIERFKLKHGHWDVHGERDLTVVPDHELFAICKKVQESDFDSAVQTLRQLINRMKR
jgi:hypothetical protein